MKFADVCVVLGFLVWAICIAYIAVGCTDTCEDGELEGDQRCDDKAERVLICIDGEWVELDNCAEAVGFDGVQLAPMVCRNGECVER